MKLIDELLEGRSTVESIAGENGLLKQSTKSILERALDRGSFGAALYSKNALEGILRVSLRKSKSSQLRRRWASMRLLPASVAEAAEIGQVYGVATSSQLFCTFGTGSVTPNVAGRQVKVPER